MVFSSPSIIFIASSLSYVVCLNECIIIVVSLRTLFRKCEETSSLVLVIRTSHNEVVESVLRGT